MTKTEILGRIEERLIENQRLDYRTKDPIGKAFREGQRQSLNECKAWVAQLGKENK